MTQTYHQLSSLAHLLSIVSSSMDSNHCLRLNAGILPLDDFALDNKNQTYGGCFQYRTGFSRSSDEHIVHQC